MGSFDKKTLEFRPQTSIMSSGERHQKSELTVSLILALTSLVAGLTLALILALGLTLTSVASTTIQTTTTTMKTTTDIPSNTTTTRTTDIPTTKTTTPGVIITGGLPYKKLEVGRKVEVFNINTKKTCQLPDLPGQVRRFHTQCGHLLCGGYYSSSSRSCLMLNPLTGDFTPTSVTLREERSLHLCWDVEGENGSTLIMGGQYSKRSTELVSLDGLTSTASFNLTYDTKSTCGIKAQDKFVITGGWDSYSPGWAIKTVTRYSKTGETETLPQLNVGRRSHACGSYQTDEGDNVLLVTGGQQRSEPERYINLDSTEVLEDMAGTWRLIAPLPSPRSGLRAASVENDIFVFGGKNENYLSDILRYNKDHTWEEVGQMKETRAWHAVAVLEDVSNFWLESGECDNKDL